MYARNCSACHGDQGLGDGPAAYLVYPKPRNFSSGEFRLTSVSSGLPTDADLLATLRRGMPGSAMPSWGHLPEEDLKALAKAVRYLSAQGKAARIMQLNKSTKRETAIKTAEKLLTPGDVVPLPLRDAARVSAARGQSLYTTNCAACHGADGRGRDKKDLKDNTGMPIFARDFTQGVFKGGSAAQDIARRIKVGMPGSPMPAAAEMPPEDLWSLVAYIQTLIKPGAQERVLQVQRTLTAKRIAGIVPSEPESAAWKQVQVTFLPVMPLWWRDDRIEGVTVRAVHDGKNLALMLEWQDATHDDLVMTPQSFTDGAAVQLSPELDPPLFAMGAKDSVVNIWHWKSTWERDTSPDGPPTMSAGFPHMPTDTYGVPQETTYLTAAAAGNPVAPAKHPSQIENLHAKGFGTLTSRAPGMQNVAGRGAWVNGTYRVVFVRHLGPAKDGEVGIEPGGTVSIAFAAWDGSVGDRNGQKSVTIWHRLALEK